MATARLGFELCALTTIPERADVGDGSGGERGTSETPPEPLRRREGRRGATNRLEDYYRWLRFITVEDYYRCEGEVRGGERGTSETPDLPVTVSKLMTCERKYAFEPCCMLFASLIRRLLCIIPCRRHFVLYHEGEFFIRPHIFSCT